MSSSTPRNHPQKWIILFVMFVIIAFNLFIWLANTDPPNRPTTPSDEIPRMKDSLPHETKPPANKIDHPIVASSSRFQTNQIPPEEDLEILIAVLDTYRRDHGGNPIGENEEIFASLRGENQKNIRYFPEEIIGLQASGIVTDRWGTPWRFHALSGTLMEITSAGPDQAFGTADDLHHK